MKVIFLDIDGVLNVYRPERDEYGRLFHGVFVNNLNTIIEETGAYIVISSTWRASGLTVMKEMWEKRELPGTVIDITPYDTDRHRGKEIQMWIDQNNEIEKYVIIDDDADMLGKQIPYFVCTSNNQHHEESLDIGYGLTKECAEKAIKILNS